VPFDAEKYGCAGAPAGGYATVSELAGGCCSTVTVNGKVPTIMPNVLLPVAPVESVTVIVKPKSPVLVGVPASTPAELNCNPGGRPPPVCDHVNGGVPPDTGELVPKL